MARDLAPEFAAVYWRSLRNAPPVEEWLAGAIGALSAGQAVVPDPFDARLGLLLELLRAGRALLVLDNLEAVLEPGAPEVRYRAGYEGYGEALRRLAEGAHAGCLLLTSREQLLPADDGAVRALRLEGLNVDAARALLGCRALTGDEAAWGALVKRYGGNPLALSVVGETIGMVFGGDIAAFLAQEMAVFGGIRQLLDAQVGRLSAPERAVLTWLAVEREPVEFAEIVADLGSGVPRGEAVEAVEALLRRSLLEWGAGGAFTLQPVVLEYATARLIEDLARGILAGASALLVGQPLLKATPKDYVRRSQERLIARPLLERLSDSFTGDEAVARRLMELLGTWRGCPAGEQGYGPGNVVNLLRLLRGDLRGLDLSRLVLRQAYLQGVDAQDASLAGSHLSEAALSEAFTYPSAVALSVDGAYLAMGTSTGEVQLRRVADRALLMVAQGHSGLVRGVALSGDGRTLASASWDGTVRLWEAPGGRPLATLRGHAGLVWGVELSRDGRTVASGGADGTVRLWEAPGGELLAILQGHSGPVRGVALSGDGRTVASGDADGTVRLWEAPSGRLLATLRGHSGAIWGVALSGDGRTVASGGADGTVRLWEALPASGSSGPLQATLQGHTGLVYDVALSADGRTVASGGYDMAARLWEAPSGRPLATLQGHSSGVQGVALNGDGRLLASGGLDGTVRLWEAPSGRPLATLQGHSSGIWTVALNGDGRLLASGSQDGTVRLWGATSGKLLAALRGHAGGVRGVALSADGRLLASGDADGTVRLWEAPSGRLLATLWGHTSGVQGVALSADGRLVASASWDGTARLWEASHGEPLATLEGHSGPVRGVALSADGRLVVSGGWDGTVRLWEAPSGRPLATLHEHTGGVRAVALSADGRLVAGASWDGTVRLWEAPSGRLLATLHRHAGMVWGVALSGDGRLLGSASYDGTVTLWDTRSAASDGVRLRTLRADRRYERLDISGLTGVTEAQRSALRALGAVEQGPAPLALLTSAGVAPPSTTTSGPEPAVAGPLAQPPTNLPPARTSFVGRADDVMALSQALDPTTQIGARLLTLSGAAGSGKTRLALAVADMVRDAYEEGAWLVGLAPLPADATADPTVVAAAALNALGLHEQPGQAPPDTLVGRLQPRRLLLILDNCEHVVASCAALTARLLEACPGLRILATSQLPLGIAEEAVWPVAVLAIPDAVAGAPTEADLYLLGQSDAVRLFVERAQAVQPGFLLSAENAAAVVAICRQLDGLPLAIELAAARLHVLSVDDVLARLDDRFRLLRRGGRTAADRHQALQATMDWSYGLLDPAEQALLRRLAVFAGGWDDGGGGGVRRGGGGGGGGARVARRAAGPLARVRLRRGGGAALWAAGDSAAVWRATPGARGRDGRAARPTPALVREAGRAGCLGLARPAAGYVAGTVGAGARQSPGGVALEPARRGRWDGGATAGERAGPLLARAWPPQRGATMAW